MAPVPVKEEPEPLSSSSSSSSSEPLAGMLLVSSSPQRVQTRVSSPFFKAVGALVCFHGLQLWPSAGMMTLFLSVISTAPAASSNQRSQLSQV